MIQGARVAVVVPAHDEAAHIGRVLETMPSWVDRVVVVDDGSQDGTAAAAEAVGDPRVALVRHPRCFGVGSALITGYRRAFADGAQVVAVMAGDGQMDPADLAPLLAPALRGEADYVKGDRLSHPEVRRAMPAARWLGNHVLTWLTRAATGMPVTDSQCGYTALTRSGARQLPLDELWRGYGYPNDLLSMAASRGLRVREVVVRPVYGDERSGLGVRVGLRSFPRVLLRAGRRRLAQAGWGETPEPAPGE